MMDIFYFLINVNLVQVLVQLVLEVKPFAKLASIPIIYNPQLVFNAQIIVYYVNLKLNVFPVLLITI
jgi:hypothetical protein